MSWVRQRMTTLLEAFTLRRVLALPIVIAVVTAVVHGSIALSQVFAQSGGKLLGVPSWVYGLTAGLFLVLYFVIEYATRLRTQMEPRLKLSFNPDAEGIVRTPTEIYAAGTKIRDDEAVYLRITLTSLSKVTTKGCVAYVTQIDKKVLGGEFINIPIRGALPLINSPFDVYPRIPATIDFLKVGNYDNKLGTIIPLPFRLRGLFDDNATYRLTIDVNGDGVTETVQVDVDWSGKWDTIAAKQVGAD